MNDFFKENLKSIEEYRPDLLPLIPDTIEESSIIVDEDRNGIPIYGIEKEGYKYYLSSTVDSEAGAQEWAKQFKDISEYSTVIVIGLANGLNIEKLHKLCPKIVIVVYEPSEYLMKQWLSDGDRREIIESDYIYMSCGEKGYGTIRTHLYNLISYTNKQHVIFKVMPGYTYHYETEISMIYSICMDVIDSTVIARNTLFRFGRDRTRKYLSNLADIRKESSILLLACELQQHNIHKRPAILVAAGPSLDKNIDLLKELKGKCLILAVDSAIKALENHGIVPDLMGTIDSNKPMRFLESEQSHRIPLIMETGANTEVHKYHTGRKFYSTTSELYTEKILQRMGMQVGSLSTGGSVANNCFSFLLKSDFRTIIVIGQDLAYELDKTHVEGTYESKEANKLVKYEGIDYFEVDGYYGGKVLTEGNMDVYRKWMEKEIMNYTDYKLINSTEGGANIAGMTNMSLRDAIDKYCADIDEIDITEIINNTPMLFTEDEKDIFLGYLKETRVNIKSYIDRFQQGIDAYDQLDKLKSEHKEAESEFEKAFNTVSQINLWTNSCPEKEILDLYEIEDSYKIQDQVLEEREDQEEEWNTIIQLGKLSFEKYKKACQQFLEDTEFYDQIH